MQWPGNNPPTPQGGAPNFPNPNYPPFPGSPQYGAPQPQSFPQQIPRSAPPPVSRESYPVNPQQSWSAYPGQQSANYPPPTGFHPGNYPVPPGPPPPQVPPGTYPHQPAPPGNYPPPPSGPSGPPGTFPPPQGYQGYAPQGGYAPPSAPPGGYGAPSGPPPRNPSYPPPPGAPPQRPPTEQQFYGPQFQGGPNQHPQQPFFQYSQCNRKKKALLVGINYFGQSGQLRGCINDANNLKAFLMSHFGYREENIKVLTDDSRDPMRVPTRHNILEHMKWLVSGAMANDSFFFHYSGHGGQTKDTDGDEADGHDEVIYPVDFQTNGHIVDDLMHDMMVRPLPPGCRLTAIFDSCHSGSALDLPYVYSTEGKVKEPNIAAEAGLGVMSAVTAYARRDMGGVIRSVSGLIKTASGSNQKADRHAKATRTSPADCISFSGCKDSQTSADTQAAGKATGAMSHAFVQALRKNPQQSYQQLLVSIRDLLRSGGYGQKPQLSSSHPMDTNILFIV